MIQQTIPDSQDKFESPGDVHQGISPFSERERLQEKLMGRLLMGRPQFIQKSLKIIRKGG
jgi:hypothetical protein